MAEVTQNWILITSFVYICFVTLCQATIPIQLLDCKPTTLKCLCGRSSKTVTVPIPQCKLLLVCKPCSYVKKDEICQKFSNCAECSPDGQDRCLTCPRRKFGTWCEVDCQCKNGADCDRNGRCICPEGYEGTQCDKIQGCKIPEAIPELVEADVRSPRRPQTIIYSCPPTHELKGEPVSTCQYGRWSSPPPRCLPKCPLLSSPAHGRLTFKESSLVEGATAQIVCDENYRLTGDSIITCLADGTWSSEVPRCEALSMCPDPGDAANAERIELSGSSRFGGVYVQDSKLKYTCNSGYEQMGEETILCLFDGTWSAEPPSCVNVAKIKPDCNTIGSEVVSTVGVPVRIFCPPECAEAPANVWGTSIYRTVSSVCKAAVHSGKLTNSGGLVSVINNGPYSHFAGSNINNVQTQSFDGRDESFRFDKLPSMIQARENNECPKGLERLEKTCVHITNEPRTFEEAEAVCTNLGLKLTIPESADEQRRLLLVLSSKGIDKVWIDDSSTESIPSHDTFRMTPLTANRTEYDLLTADRCGIAVIDELKIVKNFTECNDILYYVCTLSAKEKILESCQDPGPLTNGAAKPVGQMNGIFFVGSSIEYSCEKLYHLQGEAILSCTAGGKWSAEKPKCIRVDACEEPPVPQGGFVNYLPPLKTQGASRTAMTRAGMAGLRTGRLPAGLAADVPPENMIPTTTALPDTVALPPGLHRIGSRAMYDCESRYYQLVGSRTRRCQEGGIWSGRPPSCIPVCGRSDSPRTPFIVNGNASDVGQWPWQAGISRYLQDYDRWFLLCGGALLTERWVITAAHCVTYAGTTLTIDPDKFRIYLGKYHREDTKDDEYVQIRKIHEIHIHPDYDPGMFDADIALIQLDEPVQLNSRVQTVCLPSEQTSRENLAEGTKGVVTGWGTNENQTYSNTLQQAVLPVVSNRKCEKGYEEADLPLTVTDNMFCAGYAEGKYDACSGDSGGPMVFLDNSSREKKWILEGIVSWGSPKGCGLPNQYGGFTMVSRFLDWIHLYF